ARRSRAGHRPQRHPHHRSGDDANLRDPRRAVGRADDAPVRGLYPPRGKELGARGEISVAEGSEVNGPRAVHARDGGTGFGALLARAFRRRCAGRRPPVAKAATVRCAGPRRTLEHPSGAFDAAGSQDWAAAPLCRGDRVRNSSWLLTPLRIHSLSTGSPSSSFRTSSFTRTNIICSESHSRAFDRHHDPLALTARRRNDPAPWGSVTTLPEKHGLLSVDCVPGGGPTVEARR